MDQVKINIMRNFGPSVMKVTIPNNIIDNLNTYIDSIIKNKEKSSELNLGEKLVGDVTQEFKLEKKIMQESGWGKFLGACTNRWIEMETNKKISEFNIIDSW